MITTNPFDDDKLREECGIFGVWNADNAASFTALGAALVIEAAPIARLATPRQQS